jgi:hypothetical protein
MTMGHEPPRHSWGAYRHDSYATDSRAVLSLALGLASIVTCGLTGVPAVALGFSARAAIARSGGLVRGTGMAAWGIATGIAGTAVSVLGMIGFVISLVLNAHTRAEHNPVYAPAAEETTPAAASAPPSIPAGPTMIGSIRLVDLDPDAHATFHEQLAAEYRRAESAHQMLVVMTNKKVCDVCDEIAASLADPRMQAALANVDIVRVDVEDFASELHAGGMLEDTLPWFYKVDTTLRPIDSISAGEWDANIPQNMAPVLRAFVTGTLRARRDSAQGTSL